MIFGLDSAAPDDAIREEWGGLAFSLFIWIGRCRIALLRAEQNTPRLLHLGVAPSLPVCARGERHFPHRLRFLSVWLLLGFGGEVGEGRVRQGVSEIGPGDGSDAGERQALVRLGFEFNLSH